MNVADLWDWTFMWQMFRNFMATGAPFIMVVVAVSVAGMLIGILVNMFLKRRSS